MKFPCIPKFVLFGCALFINVNVNAQVNSQFSDLLEKAATVAGVRKDYGKARTIPEKRGMTIELKGKSIIVDGKIMDFPGSLSSWRSALGPNSLCTERKVLPTHCKSENLGIEFGTSITDRSVVSYITIHFQSEANQFKRNAIAQGDPERRIPTFIMRNVFLGNFILDDYRIDGTTMFWELQSMANRSRNIRCNVRDCKVPHGAFSDNANIYMELDGDDPRGTIKWVSIAADI